LNILSTEKSMNLAVQIITYNDEARIQKTLLSLKPINDVTIVVNDLGSSDNTVDICRTFGVKILHLQLQDDYADLRNRLTSEITNQWQLVLQPGEVITQGHRLLSNLKHSAYYLPIFSNDTIRKEIRLWNKDTNYKFHNLVFENLDCETQHEINAIIYSDEIGDIENKLKILQIWKQNQPASPDPYYYEACCLLNLGRLDDFERISEHYMFLESKKNSMSAVMNRYYYSLVQLRKNRLKSTLQNINLCICVKPLMAEFWCVIGDVYYHLLNKFDKAKGFYQNAIILGSRRKSNDKWPMEISKYRDYPNKMIESCNNLLNNSVTYYDARRA